VDAYKIPEDQWVEFFDRFSRDHLGWQTTIEVLAGESGPQRIAENLQLQGISFDTKGSRSCSIDLSVGNDPTNHLSHIIDAPLNIREAKESDGAIDLQIEPARGPVTLVHLRGPVH